MYQSLVEASASGKKVPDEILKAALLARAMTDVKRIVQMRDDKQALGVLLQKGSIGDETTARFALAEKELEAEILDVVSEANTFREGWGQIIFPTASEMVTHMKHKDVYHAIPEERKKQVAALTAMGKPVPKPTITLPPLFTPPGTQVTVQGPPGAQQQQQQQQQAQQQQQQQQQIPTPEQQQQIAQALSQYPLPPPLQQALMQAQAQGQPPPPPLQQALAAHVQEARRRFMESQGQSANVQSSPAKAGPEVAASSTNVNGAGASESAADAVAGGPQHLQPPSTPLRPSSNANSQEQSPVPSTPGSDADGGDDDDDNGDGGDGMNRAQRRQNKKNKKKGKK